MWNWPRKYKFQSSGRFNARIHGFCQWISVIHCAPKTTWTEHIQRDGPTGSYCICAVISNQYVCDFYTQTVKMVRVDRPSRNKTELALNVIVATDAAYSDAFLSRVSQIYEWYACWHTQCSRKLFGQQFSCHLVNKAALMINQSSYCH